MKIEAAAMKAFQNDVSSNPQLAGELSKTTSLINKLPEIAGGSSTSRPAVGKFGESYGDEESTNLIHGREKALDTIAKSLERKSKWLEAKTAEGDIYYWNRDTFETKSKPPKSGYLSLEEQKRMNITNAPGDMTQPTSSTNTFKVEPYGKWQTVDNRPYNENMVDLQLPNAKLPQLSVPETPKEKKEKVELSEKVVESLEPKRSGENVSFTFKKRKVEKRQLRQRDDE
ncbi:hypothetical protein B4U79_14030 [Dinothrombium tinctorium]|uniref:Uncharacterized protein n=1 Tax=Dinothrombium tinctorium TaxID=1965070 RepID=A0A443RKF0_9ACAR|nr:hypothetical protein B4U79_14030 [Dinothrombium tinctorium]